MGEVSKVSGPVVVAKNMRGAGMYNLVRVGEEELMGEIIGLTGDKATIQVYEDTSGLKPGEKVIDTKAPLSVKLGPGLLTSIYDGTQRSLVELKKNYGDFVVKGSFVDPLPKKKWLFSPTVKKGHKIVEGDVLGTVEETKVITHKILAPPGVSGTVESIQEGEFYPQDAVCELDTGKQIMLSQSWPVRTPRPVKNKLESSTPLVTGQRIFDTFFPIAKGGTAAIPGPFGSGKTVSQQQLAKWCDAEIVVYIGCGERGNEMTDVLKEFPELIDPKTGKSLMERTILIANTSNMPVAAREASVYTGVTMAEYYRDMGYDVALMADSTSRWAEAMREISGRLEEMPGEEGYPAYLASRLSRFYERASKARCLGSDPREGSVTIIGAVSPPGGDFSEPVTQNTLRITKAFWALDSKLAQRRHYPSINWLTSYTLQIEDLEEWFSEKVAADFTQLRNRAVKLLQKEAELQEIVQLVGPDALPERERVILEVSRMIREDFLQQNAYHEVDTYCELEKQYALLKHIMDFYEHSLTFLEQGGGLSAILSVGVKSDLARYKYEKDHKKASEEIGEKIRQQLTFTGA